MERGIMVAMTVNGRRTVNRTRESLLIRADASCKYLDESLVSHVKTRGNTLLRADHLTVES
jgi:hypothetical protein